MAAKRRKTTTKRAATEPRTRQVAWRIPVSLIDRLDAHAEAEAERTGARPNRTGSLVRLLADALERAGF